VKRTLRYVEHLSDARTPLEDFFNTLSAEQLASSGADKRKDGRVLQPPLNGDRVEMLDESVQPSDHLHLILATDLLFDHCGSGENPMAVLTEGFERRTVVELADHGGMHAMVHHPLVHQTTKHGARGREKERRVAE